MTEVTDSLIPMINTVMEKLTLPVFFSMFDHSYRNQISIWTHVHTVVCCMHLSDSCPGGTHSCCSPSREIALFNYNSITHTCTHTQTKQNYTRLHEQRYLVAGENTNSFSESAYPLTLPTIRSVSSHFTLLGSGDVGDKTEEFLKCGTAHSSLIFLY